MLVMQSSRVNAKAIFGSNFLAYGNSDEKPNKFRSFRSRIHGKTTSPLNEFYCRSPRFSQYCTSSQTSVKRRRRTLDCRTSPTFPAAFLVTSMKWLILSDLRCVECRPCYFSRDGQVIILTRKNRKSIVNSLAEVTKLN